MARHDRKTEEVLTADPLEHKVSAYARAIQISLCKRDFKGARAVIDHAEDELVEKLVTLDDHPVRIVPVYVANRLEEAGFFNIRSLVHAKAEELQDCRGLDSVCMRLVLSSLLEHGFGLNESLRETWNQVKYSSIDSENEEDQ